jgi:formylglycine-generating enzyme required for sulfatase activity
MIKIFALVLTMILSASCQKESIQVVSPEGVGVLIKVTGGTFQMGDEHGDLWDLCQPVHTMSLTYDYCIGKYEVTFAEYDQFCTETGKNKPSDEGWGRVNMPVFYVDWWDAISYCNWLSEKDGYVKAYDNEGNLLDHNGQITKDITKVKGYRLPTEAEWEYAARGGNKKTNNFKYSGSDDQNEVGWYWQNSGDKWLAGNDSDYNVEKMVKNNCKSHPVGQLKPNELGIYDMSGNVWEWCHDWWASYTDTQQINYIGTDTAPRRVKRGGSWSSLVKIGRVAYRSDYGVLTQRGSNLGFRIARTVN